MAENSRWDLEERDVGRYITRSFDFVMDFLVRESASEPYRLDPSGDRALRAAKLVRRAALRRGRRRGAERGRRASSGCPRATWRSRGRSPVRSTCRLSRQELIHLLGVRAPLRLLHHEPDQHALQLALAGGESRGFVGMLGPDFIDPAREGGIVADLEQAVALRDRRRAAALPSMVANTVFAALLLSAPFLTRAMSSPSAAGSAETRRCRRRNRWSAAITSPITQFAAVLASPDAATTPSK